jgi:hypothetical protein
MSSADFGLWLGMPNSSRNLYVFVYHNREGADLMYRGQWLGQVRWRDGGIAFIPPLPPGTEPALSDEIFDAWVSRAEYRNTTEI